MSQGVLAPGVVGTRHCGSYGLLTSGSRCARLVLGVGCFTALLSLTKKMFYPM